MRFLSFVVRLIVLLNVAVAVLSSFPQIPDHAHDGKYCPVQHVLEGRGLVRSGEELKPGLSYETFF